MNRARGVPNPNLFNYNKLKILIRFAFKQECRLSDKIVGFAPFAQNPVALLKAEEKSRIELKIGTFVEKMTG